MKVNKNSAQKIAFRSEDSEKDSQIRQTIISTRNRKCSKRNAPNKRSKPSSKRRSDKLGADVWDEKPPWNNAADTESDSHAGVELDDANVPKHRDDDRQVESCSESEDKRGLGSFGVSGAWLEHASPKNEHKSCDAFRHNWFQPSLKKPRIFENAFIFDL